MTEQQTEQRYNDEVDLREVWGLVVRRKWLILAFVGLTTMIGLGYGLSLTPQYLYSTIIEVGSVVDSEKINEDWGEEIDEEAMVPVLSLNVVVNRLNNTFIPRVADSDAWLDAKKVGLTARIFSVDQQLIALESFGYMEDMSQHVAFHSEVTDALMKNFEWRPKHHFDNILKARTEPIEDRLINILLPGEEQLFFRLERLEAEEKYYAMLEVLGNQFDVLTKSTLIPDPLIAAKLHHDHDLFMKKVANHLRDELPRQRVILEEKLRRNQEEQARIKGDVARKIADLEAIWPTLPPSRILEGQPFQTSL